MPTKKRSLIRSEHTRYIGVRLLPEGQDDLQTILRAGKASSITDAIHIALERAARGLRRRRAA